MPYVPPALRKGAKYQSFRKGASMTATQRTKYRQGDYVFYKNTEARVAKVKAGYDGEPNLYQVRWQGKLVDKVPEHEISLKMLEHGDLMRQEIPSPRSSSEPASDDEAPASEEPVSPVRTAPTSLAELARTTRTQSQRAPATAKRSQSYLSGTRSARGVKPRQLSGYGGSFRSLSLADEDPGSIRGSKKQSSEIVWNRRQLDRL